MAYQKGTLTATSYSEPKAQTNLYVCTWCYEYIRKENLVQRCTYIHSKTLINTTLDVK